MSNTNSIYNLQLDQMESNNHHLVQPTFYYTKTIINQVLYVCPNITFVAILFLLHLVVFSDVCFYYKTT